MRETAGQNENDAERRRRRPATLRSLDTPTRDPASDPKEASEQGPRDEQSGQNDDEPGPPGASDRLAQANREAIRALEPVPVDEVVTPCPFTRAHKLESIRFRVLGEDDRPLPRQAIELIDVSTGAERRARTLTDTAGEAEFRGVRPGPYRASLHELDRDAWELLPAPGRPVTPGATDELSWEASPPAEPVAPALYEVRQGECIASVAAQLGFFPQTLWQASENTELRGRRATGYVLHPGDRLGVPAKRRREIDVQAGQSLQLRRRGIPEVLRVRFEDETWRPRAGVGYLLDLEVASGPPPETVAGTLNADGLLIEPIPPDATLATITLDPDGIAEIVDIALGHLDPITEVSGVQGRLNNLGFSCGEVDGRCGDETRGAIVAFQAAHGLPETGDPRDPTFVEALRAAHFS